MNKNITVEEILKATNGTLIYGSKLEECESFSKNTKEVKEGDVYIGFKGERFDGGKFYEDALKNGAKGAIINKIDGLEIKRLENKFVIQVDDTVEAVGKIAKLKREKYNIPVIAITGSVGKTSTKDIIYSVVSQKYNALKTQGNMNNHIGMPMTILGLRDHEALVVEMGMNHFGEISLLTNIAKPTLAVITNIGTSHIGNLGSRENILKAKLEILEGMKIPKIIINNDNDLLHNWYQENKGKFEIHTFGLENESEIEAKDIKMEEESSDFTAITDLEKIKIHVPVGGTHFVYNALCAMTVGKVLGISYEQIKQGIASFELTQKRMDMKKLDNGALIINDAYNASFESMKVSLEFLAKHTGKRKIAVLGDMFELGEYTEELHRKVGKEVVKNKIDILICAGENSKYIIDEVKKHSNIKTYFMNNNEEIVEKLNQELKKGDVVLVKASNGMKFFEICQKV